MPCNYCQCKEYEIIAQYTRFEKRNVLKCKECGLVYLEVTEGKEEVESYYASEYRKTPTLPTQSSIEHFNDEVTQNDANNQLEFIMRFMDVKGKSILEMGCATGALLEKLVKSRCENVTGIELTKDYAEYARGKGFFILSSSIEQLTFVEKFDAVVSFHTMEHVYDPNAVVEAINMALKQGGYFMGEVPNENEWGIKIFNDEVIRRFHYDPNHLYYYSSKTLTNYLTACGFKVVKLETVERYNSFVQLRNILRRQEHSEDVEETMRKYIFPKTKTDEVRLPNPDNLMEVVFNKVFGEAVNSELMGNCLRWVAEKV